LFVFFFFFFNDTATTEIYTLSLHDALPIWPCTRHAAPTAVAARPTSEPVLPLHARRLVARRGVAREGRGAAGAERPSGVAAATREDAAVRGVVERLQPRSRRHRRRDRGCCGSVRRLDGPAPEAHGCSRLSAGCPAGRFRIWQPPRSTLRVAFEDRERTRP